MANTTTSIYGASLQAALIRNLPLEFPANTTLNEKFNVQPDARPPVGTLPTMKYFAIGRGGHRNVTGSDGESLNQLEWHKASNAALYKHLPFVIRAENNDLSEIERRNYAMRTEEVYFGNKYYVYYLMRMPDVVESPKLLLTTIVNGIATTVPYIPSADDLNPSPPELSPDDDITVSGKYLTATSPVTLTLEKNDIDNILAAVDVIYGNKAYATLSEISLVSGVDRIITIDVDGATANFNEATVAQCNAFQCTGPYELNSISNKLDLVYELGASEMLAV